MILWFLLVAASVLLTSNTWAADGQKTPAARKGSHHDDLMNELLPKPIVVPKPAQNPNDSRKKQPIAHAPDPAPAPPNYISIGAGYGFSAALNSAGKLVVLGRVIASDRDGQSLDAGHFTRFYSGHAGLIALNAERQAIFFPAQGLSRSALPASAQLLSAIPNVEAAAVGGEHVLLLTSSGDLFALGANREGQLGDGTTINRTAPVFVGSGFRTVAAGGAHSLAIDGKGNLFAWGANRYGQIGLGQQANTKKPTYVGGSFASIAAGQFHSLARTVAGQVFGAGRNDDGQVGLPASDSPVHRFTEIPLPGIPKAITAGADFSLALGADGQVSGWGNNDQGQLGAAAETRVSPPKALSLAGSYQQIAAGASHVFALDIGGVPKGWGANDSGQLGQNRL